MKTHLSYQEDLQPSVWHVQVRTCSRGQKHQERQVRKDLTRRINQLERAQFQNDPSSPAGWLRMESNPPSPIDQRYEWYQAEDPYLHFYGPQSGAGQVA
jgi:hypothetical protein